MTPEHGRILFFDGTCGLCSRCVRFARKHDRSKELRFAPIEGATWSRQFGDSITETDRQTVHLIDGQHHYRRSSAIVRLLMGCTGPWPVIGCALWLIPKPIRDLGYEFVARRRYRLFGRTDACPLEGEGGPPCMLP